MASDGEHGYAVMFESPKHEFSTQNHRPFAKIYANESARLAATGFGDIPFGASDLYKTAWQADTSAIYILTSSSPPGWTGIGAGSGLLPRLALVKSASSNYSLQNSDSGYIVRVTAAATITLGSALTTNVQAVIRRATSGVVALSAASLLSETGGSNIPEENGSVSVVHSGSGVWDVYGI